MITRIAPTPSGFLHLGNAVNVVLVSWLAAAHDGTVALRIDDADAARSRAGYVDDIFDVLDWLGVTWAVGPRDAQQFADRYSQRLRTDEYRRRLEAASNRGLELYACSCSRAQLSGPAVGGCPGGCRDKALSLRTGHTALRAHLPAGTAITVAGHPVPIADRHGDVVLWRRDDLPAYHLTSIVDDGDLGTTHVVRGADLQDSSALHQYLAAFLGSPTLVEATFLHHGLVAGPGGAKLSKSQMAGGHPLPRTDEVRHRIVAEARRLGAPLDITPPA